MKLSSIESIRSVTKHPNADLLDIVQVLGYSAIVKRDQYKVGDHVIFIQPDSVLPDKPWAAFYKAKSSRVRAIKLRGVWSMGVVESFQNVLGQVPENYKVGDEIDIGVTKYEPPQPADNSAKGFLPYGIPKTDQERYQSLAVIPYGEIVDVTLKVDGQSFSAYVKLNDDGTVATGITGRTLEFKDSASNNYTRAAVKHNIIEKLTDYAKKLGKSIAIRGESYGKGIQNFGHNPHAKKEHDLAIFSTYLIDEHRYANKGDPLYFVTVAADLGLPTVPIVETDVVLTEELIKKYDEGIDKIDGVSFEGVVINHANGSFKVINKDYDSKK